MLETILAILVGGVVGCTLTLLPWYIYERMSVKG